MSIYADRCGSAQTVWIIEQLPVSAFLGKQIVEQRISQGQLLASALPAEAILVHGAFVRFHIKELAGCSIVDHKLTGIIEAALETAASASGAYLLPIGAIPQIYANYID